MKLKNILFVLLSVIIFSCNTELVKFTTEDQETTEEQETTDNTLIKKIVYNKGTIDEYSETFNYDGNKLTSVDEGDGYQSIYTYENNLLVKEEQFLGGELAEYTILEYNSDEKIATYTETFLETSGLGDRKYKHIITYNNDVTLTDEAYVSYSNADFELNYTQTITLDGKNIAKIADDNGYKISYTYDDKNGMFKNIHAIEVLNILSETEFGAYIYGNSNNIVSYIETDASSSDNYNDSYVYTYNEDNYPKTCIYTSQYGNLEDDVETIKYFYE